MVPSFLLVDEHDEMRVTTNVDSQVVRFQFSNLSFRTALLAQGSGLVLASAGPRISVGREEEFGVVLAELTRLPPLPRRNSDASSMAQSLDVEPRAR
jgi:hypothetical protein